MMRGRALAVMTSRILETPAGFDVLANGGLLISDWALDRFFEIGPRSAP